MKNPSPHLPRNSSSTHDAAYRPCVGMAIFNHDGFILVAERIDHPGNWQMPQGGIDADESPEVAVFREMEEEIGTRNAKIIGTLDEWISYDFPPHIIKKLNTDYRGQRQKWIALRFMGQDHEIQLEAHSHPEFSQWKWIPINKLLDYVVPFKREVYARIMQEFEKYAVKSG